MHDHGIDQAGNLVELGEVVDHGQHFDALRFQVGLGFREFVGLARGDGQLGAHFAQCFGHLQAQATRTAGDQGDLAGEIKQLLYTHGDLLSDDFEQAGGTLAAADAHGDDDELRAASLALDQRMADQARARDAVGMADGGAAR